MRGPPFSPSYSIQDGQESGARLTFPRRITMLPDMNRRGYLYRSDVQRLKARNIHLCIGRNTVGEAARFEPPFFLSKPLHGFDGGIGAFTFCQSLLGGARKIGRYCSISNDVHLGGAEHPWQWAATSTFSYDPGYMWKPYLDSSRLAYAPRVREDGGKRHGPIEIGNDVWIGVGAFIRAGVHIGDGAVVGAHASVTQDVAPYTVVAGNPARVIRQRFPDAMIEKLQALCWWDYKFPDFNGFPVEDPERFIAAIEEGKSRGALKPYKPAPFTGAALAVLLRKRPEDWLLRLFGYNGK